MPPGTGWALAGAFAFLLVAALARARIRLTLAVAARVPEGPWRIELVWRLGPVLLPIRPPGRAWAAPGRRQPWTAPGLALDLLGRARLESVSVRAELALGDAAETAVAVGALEAALWNVAALLAWSGPRRGRSAPPAPFDVRVAPDFGLRPRASLRARCIWSLGLGDLTLVGARRVVRAVLRGRPRP
ncbi:MAG: hypothetical protein IRZ11_00225 [Clostridia bacterium]|nr:hypothetical protein [Clostridia bacterium]